MDLWQRREYEQQRFIEKMAERVRDVAEASGNYTAFIAEFSIALLRSVVSFAGGESKLDFPKSDAERLQNDIFTKIVDFQRVESEKVYLVGLLLEKLSVSIYSFTQREYSRDCTLDPQKVYGAEA